ncbi:MAG: glycoside hydrolase family 2 protein, partial [Clostridia bacterium]|nr:glycoside hydrolase family 2 protein [Clostridia bacterium]
MRQIISLNRKWAFTMDASCVPSALPTPAYFVNVPHSWNAIDGQDGAGDYHRGLCYYVKNLSFEDLPEGEKLFIEIQGANSSADLYVGGKHMAHHDGGYSTWRVDVTGEINRTGDTLIVIGVDNSANETVYPQMADFTFYGGLYRDVNLIGVPQSHFDLEYYGAPGIAVTPVVEGKNAKVKTE